MAVRSSESDARPPVPADDGDELVLRTTPAGRYTYVSPAVRRILGYEPEELLAQAPFDTVHPDDLPLVVSVGDRFTAGSDEEAVLFRKRHADGHDVWLDARLTNVRDPETREVVEIRATARDVTAQVVTERALRQRVEAASLIGEVSRELLTATADEIDAIIVRSLERATRFLGAERATLMLLSNDGEAAVRTHQWAVDPAFETAESLVPVATAPWLIDQCRGGDVVFARSLEDFPPAARVERESFERNGVQSIACVPITSGDELTGGLAFTWRTRVADDCSAALSTLGVLADVLVVALDRRDAEQALANSEARFRSLVQGTSDLILVTDRDAVVQYASPSIRQFGYAESDVLGASAFEYVHPEDVDRIAARFEATMTPDSRDGQSNSACATVPAVGDAWKRSAPITPTTPPCRVW